MLARPDTVDAKESLLLGRFFTRSKAIKAHLRWYCKVLLIILCLQCNLCMVWPFPFTDMKNFVQDRHGELLNTFPPRDDQENLALISGRECNGETVIVFVRQLGACQSGQDRTISVSILLLRHYVQ